jgi:hypothetical protein
VLKVEVSFRLGARAGLILGIHIRPLAAGLSLAEYFASRDPVSSAAYFASLGVYAILPLALSRPGSSGRVSLSDRQ